MIIGFATKSLYETHPFASPLCCGGLPSLDAFTLSLLTYYIHGFFNNFLDTDKLSVPFWAFTAVIVALDVYSEKKDPSPTLLTTNPDSSANEEQG